MLLKRLTTTISQFVLGQVPGDQESSVFFVLKIENSGLLRFLICILNQDEPKPLSKGGLAGT